MPGSSRDPGFRGYRLGLWILTFVRMTEAVACLPRNKVIWRAPFEMMFYPGYTHRVSGPGISEHVWGTILNFLDRTVKDKPVEPVPPAQ